MAENCLHCRINDAIDTFYLGDGPINARPVAEALGQCIGDLGKDMELWEFQIILAMVFEAVVRKRQQTIDSRKNPH
jgi:hypothetical protein